MKKILLFSFLCVLTLTSYAQKKPFSIETLYKVKGVSAPVVSPEGDKAVFTVSTSNLKAGTSNSDIYLLDIKTNKTKPILDSKSAEYNPLWLTDNEIIYQKDGQLFSYNIDTKKDEKLTDLSIEISNPVISPDKENIAFETYIYPGCGADNDCNKKVDEKRSNGPLQAVITDDLLFRHWTSYRDEMEPHIFLFNLKTKKITDVVKSEWISSNYMLGGEIRYAFDKTGKELFYMSTDETKLASSTNADLYKINLQTHKIEKLTTNKGWDGYPVLSPDGNLLAYKLQKQQNYEADKYQLAIYDLKNKSTKILTENFDYPVDEIEWSHDGNSIYFTADYKGYTPVFKISKDGGNVDTVILKTTSGFQFDNEMNILYAGRQVDKPSEIYKYSKGKLTQITDFNKELLNEYDFRPAEQVWIKGADGVPVHCFIVKPHNFDPNKKYPLIFNVHGGPQMEWVDAFRGDWQVYPGYGYIVAFCNPHGSTGYGSKYTEAISGDWGGKVFEDLMDVTDYLENLPYVDKDRIGAMGWSYGGYMMNWFQAKTKRFKCLASMMGIYDIGAMWGATEELWFVNWDVKGQPWNSDLYKKWSPSTYVKDFSTPALIITGERDYRIAYTQGIQYFTTLKTLGIDSRLIIFKNDGHWPNNVKSMPLYYNAHLEWFNKYLGGDKAPYDSKKMVLNMGFEE